MIRVSTFAALIATALVPAAQAQQTDSGTAKGAASDRGQQQSTSGTAKGAATDRDQQSTSGTAKGAATGRNQQQSTSASGRSAVSDALFAAAAGSGGMAEVAISELGVQKATDSNLKKFSQQMIDDHTRMNAELKALASQKGVALPPVPDVRAQFCHQSLAGLSGQEFDKCYAKAQLVIHMDSVAMFEAEAERGQDPDMKALAAKSLPRIQHHLSMIRPIAMKYMDEKGGQQNSGHQNSDQQKSGQQNSDQQKSGQQNSDQQKSDQQKSPQ